MLFFSRFSVCSLGLPYLLGQESPFSHSFAFLPDPWRSWSLCTPLVSISYIPDLIDLQVRWEFLDHKIYCVTRPPYHTSLDYSLCLCKSYHHVLVLVRLCRMFECTSQKTYMIFCVICTIFCLISRYILIIYLMISLAHILQYSHVGIKFTILL